MTPGTPAAQAPERANDVVAAINAAIDGFRATHASLQNIVLVGGDGVVPFARLDDFTSVANESGYDTATVRNSYLGYGARAGKMLSDDPYADLAPVPYLGRQLHVPSLAVGRLVETPTQISSQVHAFALSTNGRLNPQTALTTGYDFLKDGATSVSAFLGQYVSVAGANRSVINDAWTRSTLVGVGGQFLPTGGPVPAVTSLNGHADFYGFQPAVLEPDASQPVADPRRSGFVTTDDVTESSLTFDGRIVFSMGCHAGLNVMDLLLSGGPACERLGRGVRQWPGVARRPRSSATPASASATPTCSPTARS